MKEFEDFMTEGAGNADCPPDNDEYIFMYVTKTQHGEQQPIPLDEGKNEAVIPVLSENALYTLKKRYLRKSLDGKILETPDEMFWRVAKAAASAEKDSETWAKTFHDMMASLEFLPNSPTLMNAGLPDGQLAACFVLPVEDSIDGIFDSIKHAAIIHKSGGGTGFSFSRLRPAGDCVQSTGGVASGPISFMKIFNAATEQVKQGGKRRGANMGILRIDHPDIADFIKAKEEDGQFNNFNFSVAVTDNFMSALRSGADYDLINPHTGERKKESARKIFDMLVDHAWRNGEPGVIFIDKINKANPVPEQGEIESTNPCGEQPLLPYEACNLGSINLAKFAGPEGMDYGRLGVTVANSIRFLDDIIEISRYPLPEIEQKSKNNRKIGLGVMGFADALFIMGIPYNSESGRETGAKIMEFIKDQALLASTALGDEKGTFPACQKSLLKDLMPRNATLTTIAPTGTLSIIANCSSGIEPLFSLAFIRRILDGSELREFNPVLERKLGEMGLSDKKDIIEKICQEGNLKNVSLSEKMKKIFVTAMEISPEDHLLMQAAFQKFTDNAVSKTVNLPESATREDVAGIYNLAYDRGCKGVTVYRDGSRKGQPMSVDKKGNKIGGQAADKQEKMKDVLKRPDTLSGFTTKIRTGLGMMYLTVNELDGKPFEVFATIGKSGRSTMAKAEAIGRLVSLALRSGIKVEDIIRQIKGIGGEHPIFNGGGMLLSIPDAIAKTLEDRYVKKEREKAENSSINGECPECGGELAHVEGCVSCLNCSWSKCS